MHLYNLLSSVPLLIFTINSQIIKPKGYIVTLHPSKQRADPVPIHLAKVKDLFNNHDKSILEMGKNEIGYVYNRTIPGYSAKLTTSMMEKIRNMKEVAEVEEDQISSINLVQSDAPWGLARLSSQGNFDQTYRCDERGGEGVAVYVIDSGINIQHEQFQGRAIWGANMVYGTPDRDENGHGTHCAGTVGSYTYGVAKRATLIAVKVLDGSGRGQNSDIIAGIDWAVNHAYGRRGNVINLSLGSGRSAATNYAVRRAVQSGFVVAVAAGNDNTDACSFSPASEPSAITVGSISYNNARSSFSNYGTCLDLFAPGDQILSTSHQNNYGTTPMSGTSMASPHVAGLAAYLLTTYPSATPDTIPQLLQSLALRGVVSNSGYGSPNLLLNNGGH